MLMTNVRGIQPLALDRFRRADRRRVDVQIAERRAGCRIGSAVASRHRRSTALRSRRARWRHVAAVRRASVRAAVTPERLSFFRYPVSLVFVVAAACLRRCVPLFVV